MIYIYIYICEFVFIIKIELCSSAIFVIAKYSSTKKIKFNKIVKKFFLIARHVHMLVADLF